MARHTLVQSPCKSTEVLETAKHSLSHDLHTPLLRIHGKDSKSHDRGNCTSVFILIPTKAKIRGQPGCVPSAEKWVKKREPGYVMGFSSAIIGDRVCVCVCVKVKGRCGEEGSSGRGNKNSLGYVCVRANYDIYL